MTHEALSKRAVCCGSGKDLDLGPNDLHLDDFLLSGKFDLIAYADPELNLEDKKDMFNEELDLGETVEDSEAGDRRDGPRKTDGQTHLVTHVKQEAKDAVKMEAESSSAPPPGVISTAGPPGPPGADSSAVLTKVGPCFTCPQSQTS